MRRLAVVAAMLLTATVPVTLAFLPAQLVGIAVANNNNIHAALPVVPTTAFPSRIPVLHVAPDDQSNLDDDASSAPSSPTDAVEKYTRKALLQRLWDAVLAHDGQQVMALIAQSAVPIDQPNPHGDYPAHLAVRFGWTRVLRVIAQRIPLLVLQQRDARGLNALQMALSWLHYDAAVELLVHGLVAPLKLAQPGDHDILAMAAAAIDQTLTLLPYGSVDARTKLPLVTALNQVADVLAARDPPLLMQTVTMAQAAQFGITAVLEHYIAVMPSVVVRWRDTTTSGATLLILAAAMPGNCAVRLLIDSGVDVNALETLSSQQQSALIVAARAGALDHVVSLLEAGADPTLASASGETPLHAAAKSGCFECVVRLMYEFKSARFAVPRRGVDVDARDSVGKTALHYAVEAHSTKIIQFLLDSGANVNSVDQHGFTPLHRAVTLPDDTAASMVGTLLRCGADPLLVTYQYDTPLHLAAFYGNWPAAKLLTGLKEAPMLLMANRRGVAASDWAKARGHHAMAFWLAMLARWKV